MNFYIVRLATGCSFPLKNVFFKISKNKKRDAGARKEYLVFYGFWLQILNLRLKTRIYMV